MPRTDEINYYIDIHYKTWTEHIPLRSKRMFEDLIHDLNTPNNRMHITDGHGEPHIINTFDMVSFSAYRVEEDEE